MRVERREDGAMVSGFLDTGSAGQGGAFDTVLVRGTHPYQAEMRPHCLGAMNACDITGDSPVGVLPLLSPTARGDRHTLGLLLAGHGTLEQDGRQNVLAPGDFVIYRGRRPFRLELSGPYRYFVIDLGQEDTGCLRHAGAAITIPDLPSLASARILQATLAGIAEVAARMGPLTRQEMGEHISCMLRTLIREASRRGPDDAGARAAVLNRVLSYIEQHLDGELSPESIAAAHHISVRYLHMLFQGQSDTVSHHIRRRRLDHIREDLADRALARLPAYTIAARWGIANPSHFSKLFRMEFGLSPDEFRRQARVTVSPGRMR
jgi:AraC-like DNA-binding protein